MEDISKLTDGLAKNTLSMKSLGFLLPLFIVFYYMYSDDGRRSQITGAIITFLIGSVIMLCKCDKSNTNTFVLLIALLVYSLVAMFISLNINKLSKFKYFVINTIVQYSIYLNMFLILLR